MGQPVSKCLLSLASAGANPAAACLNELYFLMSYVKGESTQIHYAGQIIIIFLFSLLLENCLIEKEYSLKRWI